MAVQIIGAPAKPYRKSVVDAVVRAVESVSGIAEAHMPQWFEAGLTEGAEQVLVPVLAKGHTKADVMPPLLAALQRELPDGPAILSIPLTGRDGSLDTVRGTGTKIFDAPGIDVEPRPPRPWWKFW